MEAKNLRIVFMGTPELAAWSLKELAEQGYNIAGVVTAPDKPAGRGRKLAASAVKEYAISRGITVLQPDNLKSSLFLEQLKALKPDLQVVVAFRMLPQQVWDLPPLGTFNMHASLLPQYRGAAPINRAIMNGEKITGVTTFLLDKEIDTGKILFRQPIIMDEWETAGSLHEKVKTAGSELVIKTISALAKGDVKPLDQDKLIKPQEPLKKAPKIFKEDCLINWDRPGSEVASHIHGLNPVPGAYTIISGPAAEQINMKIYDVRPEKTSHQYPSGTLISDNKKYLGFTTSDGIIWVKNLQLSGKRRMNAEELMRGFIFHDSILQEQIR